VVNFIESFFANHTSPQRVNSNAVEMTGFTSYETAHLDCWTACQGQSKSGGKPETSVLSEQRNKKVGNLLLPKTQEIGGTNPVCG
jgi:hypothetical protein